MPLAKGNSRKTISNNIREFHTGKTYVHTAAKFGKEKANKQAIAVALSTARRYGKRAKGGKVKKYADGGGDDDKEMTPNPEYNPNLKKVYIGAPPPQVPISGAPEGYQPEPSKPVRPSILDYIKPGEDYWRSMRETHEMPATLGEMGKENIESGEPGKVVGGLGQTLLGGAMHVAEPVIAPIQAATTAAVKGIGHLLGPGPEHGADVASFFQPGSANKAVLAGLGFTAAGVKNIKSINEAIMAAINAGGEPNKAVYKSIQAHYPKDIANAAFHLGATPEQVEAIKAQMLPGGQTAFDKHYNKLVGSGEKSFAQQQSPSVPPPVPVEWPKPVKTPLPDTLETDLEDFIKSWNQTKNKPTLATSAPQIPQSKQDADGLLKKYKNDTAGMAKEIYDSATEVGVGYANSIVKHLPEHLKADIGMEIDKIAREKGHDPWKEQSTNSNFDYWDDKEYQNSLENAQSHEQLINEGGFSEEKPRGLFAGERKPTLEDLNPDLVPPDLQQKAERLGLNTPAFHGTFKNFSEFKLPEELGAAPEIGVHFGTMRAALDRLGVSGKIEHERRFRLNEGVAKILKGLWVATHQGQDEWKVMPAMIGLKNPIRMPDLGTWHAHRIVKALEQNPEFTKAEIEAATLGHDSKSLLVNEHVEKEVMPRLRKLIESKGYDGIEYINRHEDQGSVSYVIWDLHKARSLYAKFDPAHSHSRNLGAGIAGLSLVPLGMFAGANRAEAAEPKKDGGKVKHKQIDEDPKEHEFIDFSRGGLIDSDIPGRTDKIPMKVSPGSYVLPADIPSALGQGNTKAGHEVLKKMFTHGPYGLPPPNIKTRPAQAKLHMKADGGDTDGDADNVPIVAAGGEYIIHPDVVKHLGGGSMKHGHKLLDKFVIHTRKQHISTLKKLKPPK